MTFRSPGRCYFVKTASKKRLFLERDGIARDKCIGVARLPCHIPDAGILTRGVRRRRVTDGRRQAPV